MLFFASSTSKFMQKKHELLRAKMQKKSCKKAGGVCPRNTKAVYCSILASIILEAKNADFLFLSCNKNFTFFKKITKTQNMD